MYLPQSVHVSVCGGGSGQRTICGDQNQVSFPLCGSPGSNWARQTWQQATLPTGPSQSPVSSLFHFETVAQASLELTL